MIPGLSFRLVQSLLSLRSRNQALALGSHHTAWINDDFYLYTRNFRDSAVMVMVNKADSDHVVDAENIQMPDGTYTCLITGYPISIENGRLSGYTIHGNSAMVISVEGRPVQAPLVVVFQVNGCDTAWSSLAIVGDCDELGHWDHAKAYGMEYVNDNTWVATVGFTRSDASLLNYKFVVLQDNGEPIVEYLINRRTLLPQSGRIAIDCFWNSNN